MPFWSDEEPTGLELGEGLLLVFLSLVILMVGILSVYLATRRGGEDTPDDTSLSRRSSRHSRRASVASRRTRTGSREESPAVHESSSNESAAGTALVPSKRRSKRSMNRNRTPQTSDAGWPRSHGDSGSGINAARNRSSHFGGSIHGRNVTRPSGGSMEMRSAHIVGRSFTSDEVKSVERYDTFSITHSVGPNGSREDISVSHCGSESGSDARCLDRKGGLIYGLNCAMNYGNSNSQKIGEPQKNEAIDSLLTNMMDTRNVSRCLNRRDGMNDGLCNALRDALTDAISDALSDALTDALRDALTGGAAVGMGEGLGTSDDLCSIVSDFGTSSAKDSITGRKKGQKLSAQLLKKCCDDQSDQLRNFKSCRSDIARDTASKVGSVNTTTSRKSSPIRGCPLKNKITQKDTPRADRQIEEVIIDVHQVESGYLSCRSIVQSDNQSKDVLEEKLGETTLDDSSDAALGVIDILKRDVTLERVNVVDGAQRVSQAFGRRCKERSSDNVADNRKDNRSIGDNAEISNKIKIPPITRKKTGDECKCPSVNPTKPPISDVNEDMYKSPKQKYEQKVTPCIACNVGSSVELNMKSLEQNSDTYSTNSHDESDKNPDQSTDQSPYASTDGVPNSRGKQRCPQKKKFHFSVRESKKKNTIEEYKPSPQKDSCICKSKVGLSDSRSSSQTVDQHFGQRVGRSMDRVGDPQAKRKDATREVKEDTIRPATERRRRHRVDFAGETAGETEASKRPAPDESPVPSSSKVCPRRRRSLHTNISPCACVSNRRSRSPTSHRSKCRCKKSGQTSRN